MNALAFTLRTTRRLFQDGSGSSDSGGGSGSGESGEEEAASIIAGLTADDLILVGAILGVTIALTIATSRGVRYVVKKQNEMIATLLGRVAAGVVFTVGFVYALNSIGVAVGPLVGALGVGGFAIAFALKGILKNVLAGVLLQLRQPFNVGDLVKLEDYLGHVNGISLRTVDITTLGGEDVLIPAATVIENPIENWTSSGQRRADILIGIDYAADLPAAIEGIASAVQKAESVIDDKEVKVVAHEFGGSTINLRILAWHKTDTPFIDCMNDVIVASKQWCDENGVAMPSPIRELLFQNPDDLATAFAKASKSPNGSDGPSADEDGGEARQDSTAQDSTAQSAST